MTTQGTMPPPVTRWGAISTTVPETEACTGAETKPRTSPTFWPRSTRSPTVTHGPQGAPMCWDMGMYTRSGAGSASMGEPALRLLPWPMACSGWMPPAKDLTLFILIKDPFPSLYCDAHMCLLTLHFTLTQPFANINFFDAR